MDNHSIVGKSMDILQEKGDLSLVNRLQRWISICAVSLTLAICGYSCQVSVANAAASQKTVEYYIVTNEIKSSPKGQPEIEVYRFDPSIVIARVGERVILHFYGVKGSLHPTSISAFGVHTVIQRGAVSTVSFVADKTGYFPIVCEIHKSLKTHGPMTAALVVLP